MGELGHCGLQAGLTVILVGAGEEKKRRRK
jgi:hypothetical protein